MLPSELATRLDITLPSPERRLKTDWQNPGECEVWVKRDDLIHPVVSGNKWRKLCHALCDIMASDKRHILSFGGGYSNHLHALGYACFRLGLTLTAIVRGDYTAQPTPMLNDLRLWGVDIQYVDRKTYRRRDEPDYLRGLSARFNQPVIVPEGGSQKRALNSMGDMINELDNHYDIIMAPVASGGTLAGIVSSVPTSTSVQGIAMLKGQHYLEDLVSSQLGVNSVAKWQIHHQFHHGGYAKTSDALNTFCGEFHAQTGIPVEPVYSGKVFYAARALLARKQLGIGSRVLILHTGGLQGKRVS